MPQKLVLQKQFFLVMDKTATEVHAAAGPLKSVTGCFVVGYDDKKKRIVPQGFALINNTQFSMQAMARQQLI